MSNQPHDAPECSLPLPADAQWFVHHLVSLRLRHGGPPVEAAAPGVVRRVYRKLEWGEHAFTPAELRFLRAELTRFLRTTDAAPRNEAVALRTIECVDRALRALRTVA